MKRHEGQGLEGSKVQELLSLWSLGNMPPSHRRCVLVPQKKLFNPVHEGILWTLQCVDIMD
jgi:hypothetical protein